MTRCIIVVFATAFWVSPAPLPASDTQADASENLIKGIVARSQEVFSGRMEYRTEWGFRGEKPRSHQQYRFVFSGSSWRQDWSRPAAEIPMEQNDVAKQFKLDPRQLTGLFEMTTVSHAGKAVTYSRNPQFDSSILRSARVTKEQTMSSLHLQSPPTFLGSFWFPCTREFVQGNRQQVVRKPATTVNGVSAEVLEWPVSAADSGKAFHAVDAATRGGGLLRVSVAPELGYVLLRLEYLDQHSKLNVSFTALDFFKSSDVYFPRKSVMQYYTNGKPAFYQEHEIIHISDINAPIPDKTFVVELAVGTHVYDARSGDKSSYFEITKGGPIPEELQDILVVESPPLWKKRTWVTGLALGAGGAVVLLALGVLVRRFFRRRKQV